MCLIRMGYPRPLALWHPIQCCLRQLIIRNWWQSSEIAQFQCDEMEATAASESPGSGAKTMALSEFRASWLIDRAGLRLPQSSAAQLGFVFPQIVYLF